MRWDQGRYAIERECTCTSRSAECQGGQGYHVVDSREDYGSAVHECIKCIAMHDGRVSYRVKDQHTGEIR